MSTRSIIARPTEDGGWEGRYHHSDGYPSGVGKTLYWLANFRFADDFAGMVRTLIDEHTGWSTINANWKNPIGFCNHRSDKKQGESYDDYFARLYQESGPQCYCHGDRNEEGWMCTSAQNDSEEWIYVLNIPNRTIGIGRGNIVTHTISIDGPEPDWNSFEEEE